IVALGDERSVRDSVRAGRIVSASGRLVTPGLVDAHTHLLFAGNRAHEVALKARGASYLEILAAGGGILSTVGATRRAADTELLAATRARLRTAVVHGTTHFEIKTGYDLTPEGERHQVDLLRALREEGPWRLTITFLGAHAVPEEYRGRAADFLADLARIHPELRGRADFVDIFQEPGVFERDEARPYLEDALRHGLRIKLHVDELADGGGASLGAELGATSVDHLAHTGAAGVARLAGSGTVAVLLPGTSGYLNQGPHAPARALLEAGVPVAVASDANPGSSPTVALAPILPWAASWLHMPPEELWSAVTTVAGAALAAPDAGRLAVGAPADFLIWDTDDYQVPCYQYGTSLVAETWIGGRKVAEGGKFLG
ncbi:MAG: imidazolonepropionase, partial [Clostridia bacterium]